jgi:hypothetical protein
MPTKPTKAGGKAAPAAKKNEASKHLKTSKPKAPATKGGKPATGK